MCRIGFDGLVHDLAQCVGVTGTIAVDPAEVTSVCKLDWSVPGQLSRQAALVLIPGAVYSEKLCRTWYDARGGPSKR